MSSDFKIAVFPKDEVKKIAEWVSDVEDLHEKMKFSRKNGLGQEWKNVIELALDKSNKGRDSIEFVGLEALAMISISKFLMAKKKLGADEAVNRKIWKRRFKMLLKIELQRETCLQKKPLKVMTNPALNNMKIQMKRYENDLKMKAMKAMKKTRAELKICKKFRNLDL